MADHCDKCGQTLPIAARHSTSLERVDLLQIRHFPDHVEAKEISRVIEGHDDLLKKLDEVEHLMGKIEELRVVKEIVARRRAEYSALLSPIRYLPTEILQEVMIQAVASSQEERTTISFRLVAVSRFWRETALSTSALWKYMSVYPETSADMIEFHLSLMIPRAIDVFIMDNQESDSESGLGSSADYQIWFLLRHPERWRQISLPFLGDEDLETFEHTSFPALEEIYLGNCASFGQCPSLTSVVLYGFEEDPPLAFQIPWKQITHCELSSEFFELDECISLLEKCRQLVKLVFSGRYDVPLSSQRKVTHTGLLELELVFRYPVRQSANEAIIINILTSFLNAVSFPALKDLTINHTISRSWPRTAVPIFISRHFNSLRTLVLNYCDYSVPDIFALLRTLPALTNLRFDRAVFNVETFLEGMNTTSPPLIPLLEHIEIANLQRFNLEHAEALRKFITLRRRDAKPSHAVDVDSVARSLKTVTLSATWDFEELEYGGWVPEGLGVLGNLRDDGFQIFFFRRLDDGSEILVELNAHR